MRPAGMKHRSAIELNRAIDSTVDNSVIELFEFFVQQLTLYAR